MYDCKAPLSRFYYPDTRRIINAFIIIIIIIIIKLQYHCCIPIVSTNKNLKNQPEKSTVFDYYSYK